MQRKLIVSLMIFFIIFSLFSCGFFPSKEEVSSNWTGSIICSKTVYNLQWHYKAYGDDAVKEMKIALKKTSGNQDQWFGFRFDYINDKNYCEFMINQKGKFRIARVIDGEDEALTLIDSQPGKTLTTGKGKENIINVEIKDSKVDFYANIDEDDPAISEYFLGSLPYTKETLEHIIFAAYTGKESLAQEPLKVFITVFKEEDEDSEEEENPYTELWQQGSSENSEEGWDIYYTASKKKLNSCDIRMLDDFYGKTNDNDVKHFTAKMIKKSGGWNYGGGFVLSGSELNRQGIPTQYYLFSIDTSGAYSALRYKNMNHEKAGNTILDKFFIAETTSPGNQVSDKFLTGLGKENTFVFSRIREQVLSEDYYDIWYIWINPSEEITAENAEEKKDYAQLTIVDLSDIRLMDDSGKASGLIGFAPGVGSEEYEDLPDYPVLYKFKNILPEAVPEP